MAAHIDGATFAPAGVVSPLDTQAAQGQLTPVPAQAQAPVTAQPQVAAQAQVQVQPQVTAQAQAQVQPQVLPAKVDAFQAAPQQGIVAGGCYNPHPSPLPFPLPEPEPLPPMPTPLPEPMPRCPPPPRPDASAAAATAKLDQLPGPISGDQMAKSIQEGTKDLDGQAAGKEYKQFSNWAAQNQDKLSPEAKNVMQVYDKYAKAAQANGQTGINSADYDKMCKEMTKVGNTDVSADSATKKLDQLPKPISGEQMAKSIQQGTKDLDGQAAGNEYKQFSDWAAKNQDKLSPEAKNVMQVYDKYAKAAQANGQTGINSADYDKMCKEMTKVGQTDASVADATKKLDQMPKPISGEQMAKSIKEGTQDLDNSAAGKEYKQFADWAAKNQDKLSPEAKNVMQVYEKYAKAAQANGQTGISSADYDKMCKEMTKVGNTDVSAKQAIDGLNKGQGKVSAEDLTKAIENGTKDLDNSSAGREYDQFAKWAQQHPNRLSPEAKEVMGIYKKYADAAKAQGQTGISQADYDKMLGEMKNVHTYQDASAGGALDKLNHTSGPVSGRQMLDAIKTGTEDVDGQAAGKEMQDILAWARDNAARLSPDAKKVVAIYAKYATQALLQGSTGIDQGQYQAMLAEMRRALSPPRYVIA